MTQELIARFRIITPMFIGGANQDPEDGIRPPSVKGMLRFWWRALNWWRFLDAAKNDVVALREMHKEEARLFGSAANRGWRGWAW
ncbi:MAG: type III-B CRISPR module RAMP protein Cmr1 [bacterium]|nr:type III-B CRISPR module RAMP protein Cmr1 [bacterium]